MASKLKNAFHETFTLLDIKEPIKSVFLDQLYKEAIIYFKLPWLLAVVATEPIFHPFSFKTDFLKAFRDIFLLFHFSFQIFNHCKFITVNSIRFYGNPSAHFYL